MMKSKPYWHTNRIRATVKRHLADLMRECEKQNNYMHYNMAFIAANRAMGEMRRAYEVEIERLRAEIELIEK